jgi:hypothetical protein
LVFKRALVVSAARAFLIFSYAISDSIPSQAKYYLTEYTISDSIGSWLELKKRFGCGSASGAVISGYRAMRIWNLKGAPAVRAHTGIGLDKPPPKSVKVKLVEATRLELASQGLEGPRFAN